jgi:hypothetical protein
MKLNLLILPLVRLVTANANSPVKANNVRERFVKLGFPFATTLPFYIPINQLTQIVLPFWFKQPLQVKKQLRTDYNGCKKLMDKAVSYLCKLRGQPLANTLKY